MVVHSQEGQNKAENMVETSCRKEREKIEKALKALSAEEFLCPHDAKSALKRCFNKSKFYEVLEGRMEGHPVNEYLCS
jgi:transposase